MKMENANVEFVTFEAQDVIATSFYALGSQLNNIPNGTISTVPSQLAKFRELGSYVKIANATKDYKADVYYSISTNYSVNGNVLTLDITEAPEVGEGTHEAYLTGSDTGLALLAWLAKNGVQQ